MAKRKAESQTASLTPDQKKLGIDSIYLVVEGMGNIIEKFLTRAITLLQTTFSIRGLLIKLWGSKVAGISIGAILGLPLGSLGREKPFGCGLCGQPQSIL
jgi:hypothetical protein